MKLPKWCIRSKLITLLMFEYLTFKSINHTCHLKSPKWKEAFTLGRWAETPFITHLVSIAPDGTYYICPPSSSCPFTPLCVITLNLQKDGTGAQIEKCHGHFGKHHDRFSTPERYKLYTRILAKWKKHKYPLLFKFVLKRSAILQPFCILFSYFLHY